MKNILLEDKIIKELYFNNCLVYGINKPIISILEDEVKVNLENLAIINLDYLDNDDTRQLLNIINKKL